MTVLENRTAVPMGQAGEHLVNSWLRWGHVQAEERGVRTARCRCWRNCVWTPLKNEFAGTLSGGQKKLLELRPHDDGAPEDRTAGRIGRRRQPHVAGRISPARSSAPTGSHGYAFFVIEHDMDLIARLCDPVIVMAEGRVLTQG